MSERREWALFECANGQRKELSRNPLISDAGADEWNRANVRGTMRWFKAKAEEVRDRRCIMCGAAK